MNDQDGLTRANDPGTETSGGGRGMRYLFLDLYRGLFVVLMLEGHVVRQLLHPEATAGLAFQFHELFHGITGPGFFFGAGFTFAISSLRRWKTVTTLSTGLLRRMLRPAMLIIVGYALHVPYLSLRKTIEESSPAQWNAFLVFGVLQTIGVTLLLLYLLLVVIRREGPFLIALILLLPTIVYSAGPLAVWAESPEIPLAIRSAFSIGTGSPYPLLPFAGFTVAGVLAAWGFLGAGQRGREHRFMVALFWAGVALVVYAYLGERFLVPSRDEWTYWTTGPNFFWMRLGILALFMSVLWITEEHLRRAVLPRWLTVLGVESFFVYIVHLPILYGWVTNPRTHLTALFGPTLQPVAALAVAAALLAIMTLAAGLWRRLKKRTPSLARLFLSVCVLILGIAFIANPH